jgi:hypothetical protein
LVISKQTESRHLSASFAWLQNWTHVAAASQDLKDRFRKLAEQRREQLKVQEQQVKLQELINKFRQK